MNRFEGKSVIVTGAASGFGTAIARKFANEGAQIVCADLNMAGASELASELARVGTGNTLYILDEPTTGLHFQDVQMLIDVLHRLVDQGNTVVVIEHQLDVIKVCDHVVDVGPEGGKHGGTIVAQGTPEQVAEAPQSHTGKYLRELLAR